jgi:oligopeptide/dipeptide ABC transporter ATP-binding protein
MSTNPDVLIADEATTALDVITQARILDLLLRLVEERGTAVILITHDLGVARGFSTDVQVMYAGRIVEQARRDQFYAHPTHPYSEALLESMVRLDADLGRSIPAIPGQPPLPGRLASGCPFHPRCPFAIDVCIDTEPEPVLFAGPPPVMAECHRAAERYRVAGGGSAAGG